MTESCRLITEEQYKEWKALQERLKEAEQFVKHTAWWQMTCCGVYTDRHGVLHTYDSAIKYCEKYGLKYDEPWEQIKEVRE